MHELQALIAQHLPPGPEGFLAARVHRLFAYDPTLRAIFFDRIQLLTEFFPYDDYEDLPKLMIGPTSSREPAEAPGQREERPVVIAARVIYEATHWTPAYPGPPPDASETREIAGPLDLMAYMETLLKNNRALVELNQQMVEPGDTIYETVENDPLPLEGDRTIYYRDLRVVFRVRVNPATGQINNLDIARA